MRLVAASTLAAMVAAAAAYAINAAPSFVVRGDAEIGRFEVKSDGTLGGALRAFGTPDRKQRRYGAACTVTWTSVGLTILFNNLGGMNPCLPRSGYFARAIMHGKDWQTAKGLRVGTLSTRVRRLYPNATWHRGLGGYWPTGWWLVTRGSLYGPRAGSYPGLLAETKRGRIFSFQVRYPAGGD